MSNLASTPATPLLQKLGVKEGHRVAWPGAPDYFDDRLGALPDGAAWVSWPKKSSGVTTDITEDTIREDALPLGLVDVKVAAVDETWSGLKLVVRRELRR